MGLIKDLDALMKSADAPAPPATAAQLDDAICYGLIKVRERHGEYGDAPCGKHRWIHSLQFGAACQLARILKVPLEHRGARDIVHRDFKIRLRELDGGNVLAEVAYLGVELNRWIRGPALEKARADAAYIKAGALAPEEAAGSLLDTGRTPYAGVLSDLPRTVEAHQVSVAGDGMIDGTHPNECLEIYGRIQREEAPRDALTWRQMRAAQALWAHDVRVKVRKSAEADRAAAPSLGWDPGEGDD